MRLTDNGYVRVSVISFSLRFFEFSFFFQSLFELELSVQFAVAIQSKPKHAPMQGYKSERHVPSLLDDDPDPGSDFETETRVPKIVLTCFVCERSLSILNAEAREAHLNVCLKQLETESVSTPEVSGLRSERYSCVICDLNLSKRCLSSRCQHLKRCAKQHGVGVRDLLQMIAPNKYEEIVLTQSQRHEQADLVDLTVAGEDVSSNEHTTKNKPNFLSVLMANAKSKWGSSTAAPTANSGSTDRKGDASRKRKVPPYRDTAEGSGRVEEEGSERGLTRYTPDYKKVSWPPMPAPIVVDGFNYASSALTDCYFLTHFHSDHYGGLDKNFECGKYIRTYLSFRLMRNDTRRP